MTTAVFLLPGTYDTVAILKSDATTDADITCKTIKVKPLTVATLPTGVKGMRSFVTDSNATFTAGIGAIVAGGGANNVPVFYDGTNWRIG